MTISVKVSPQEHAKFKAHVAGLRVGAKLGPYLWSLAERDMDAHAAGQAVELAAAMGKAGSAA